MDNARTPLPHVEASASQKYWCGLLTATACLLLGGTMWFIVADVKESKATEPSHAEVDNSTPTHSAAHVHLADPHSAAIDRKPYLVALGLLLLGVSLSWWSSIVRAAHGSHLLSHACHELGMGFFVSAVVLVTVELTMHMAHGKHVEMIHACHAARIDEDNRQHNERIARNNEVHQHAITAAMKRNGELLEMKDELTDLAKVLGYRVNYDEGKYPEEAEFHAALDGCDSLGAKIKTIRETCQEWKTIMLDKYGRMLLRKGRFKEAEQQFKNALALDERRASVASSDYELQRYVVVSYFSLAEAQYKQGDATKLDEALETQGKLKLATQRLKEVAPTVKHRSAADYLMVRSEELRDNISKLKSAPTLQIGTEVTGQLDRDSKVVLYRVRLAKHTRYQIELTASTRTLDPFLTLRRADRSVVTQDDDGAGSLNARIVHECLEDGDYLIEATSAPDSLGEATERRGEFRLRIRDLAGKS